MNVLRNKAFWAKGMYVVPFAFASGLWLREELGASAEEDRIVEQRVQKALGEWKAPELTPAQRKALEEERDRLALEIAHLRQRMQKHN